jgi:hypothetical protein
MHIFEHGIIFFTQVITAAVLLSERERINCKLKQISKQINLINIRQMSYQDILNFFWLSLASANQLVLAIGTETSRP